MMATLGQVDPVWVESVGVIDIRTAPYAGIIQVRFVGYDISRQDPAPQPFLNVVQTSDNAKWAPRGSPEAQSKQFERD